MHPNRSALAVLALVLVLLTWPASSAAAAPGRPMTLADFAGQWSAHGYTLVVRPNGSADAIWRTYRWCDDVADGGPCDTATGAPIVAGGGHAVIRFTRVMERGAYGTISDSNDEQIMPNGPVSLVEYEYGIGYLMFTHDLAPPYPMGPEHGITICGPRYADAPRWVDTWKPCGA